MQTPLNGTGIFVQSTTIELFDPAPKKTSLDALDEVEEFLSEWRSALAASDSGREIIRGTLVVMLADRISRLYRELQQRYIQAESSELYTSFLEDFPEHELGLEKLRLQHWIILAALNHLLDELWLADRPIFSAELTLRLRSLISDIHKNEQAENRILQQAHNIDIPEAD